MFYKPHNPHKGSFCCTLLARCPHSAYIGLGGGEALAQYIVLSSERKGRKTWELTILAPPKLRETPVFTGFSHRGFSLPKMAAIKIPEFQGPDGIHQDGGIAAAAHGVIAYPPVDRGVSGLDCSISPGQICHRWLAPVGKMDQ